MGCPLVSVVITCYNYGPYLRSCLESVLSQTYDYYEIVVVDDGSTDCTEEIMSGYLAHPRITFIRQENRGQAVAKNVGISQARGDFVAFLDADDLWCAEKLGKQILCFDKREVGVVYCRSKFMDESGGELDYEVTGPYLQPRRGMVTRWLFYDNFVPFSSSVVRKECFDKLGAFDETLKMGIDWDLWLRISTAYQFDYVDERLIYYRVGHQGQMSKNEPERHRCSDRIMDKFLRSFPHSLSTMDLKKSMAYTYCNRASYLRNFDKKKSYILYLKAILEFPFWMPAYKGILKNLLNRKNVLINCITNSLP